MQAVLSTDYPIRNVYAELITLEWTLLERRCVSPTHFSNLR